MSDATSWVKWNISDSPAEVPCVQKVEVAICQQTRLEICKFWTEEITCAQNFTVVPQLSQNGGFSDPNFAFWTKSLGQRFSHNSLRVQNLGGGIGGVMTPLLLASWHWPILKQQFTTDPSANSKINSTIMSHSVMARIEPTQPFEYKITSIPGQSIFKHFQVPFPELSLWYFTTSS